MNEMYNTYVFEEVGAFKTDAIAEILDINNRMRSLLRSRVYITADSNRVLIGVKSPYHDRYVRDLKIAVPNDQRRWSPENRMWFVNASYFNIVYEICANVYGHERIDLYNTAGCELLVPQNKVAKKTSNIKTNLNLKVISLLKDITQNDNVVVSTTTNKEEVIEIIMDAWAAGEISDKDTLNTIYHYLNS